MNILEEINSLISNLDIPIETGVFSDTPPIKYIVLTPLNDSFETYADNKPTNETQEVRLSLFHFGNYVQTKNEIVDELLNGDFTITNRIYVGYDKDSGYHNYAIDIAKEYNIV